MPYSRLPLGRYACVIGCLLSGCASTPTNFPIRAQIDGQRGFGMQGVLKYTGDPDQTRARIQKAFDGACRGPARITQLEMKPRQSSVGLKFYDYDATALCEPPPGG